MQYFLSLVLYHLSARKWLSSTTIIFSQSTYHTYNTTIADSIEGASPVANCHYIAEITRPKGVLIYSRHAIYTKWS